MCLCIKLLTSSWSYLIHFSLHRKNILNFWKLSTFENRSCNKVALFNLHSQEIPLGFIQKAHKSFWIESFRKNVLRSPFLSWLHDEKVLTINANFEFSLKFECFGCKIYLRLFFGVKKLLTNFLHFGFFIIIFFFQNQMKTSNHAHFG